MSDKVKGVLFLTGSALGFAIMTIFLGLAGTSIPPIQKVFFRNLITFFVSFFLIVRNKEVFFGNKGNRMILVFRSSFGVIGMILYFYALDNSVRADANMLNKLSSFFIVLFSFIFLKEKAKPYQVIAIVIAFIGALFVIRPSFDVTILPYLASLASAVFAGAAYTILRYLGNKEKFYTITFFFSGFSVFVILPFMLLNYVPMSPLELIYLLLAGLFASIGQFGVTIAYKFAPAKEISIFNYLNVIFVTVMSFFVFDELPTLLSFMGYIIIFGAAYYIFRKNQQLA